jgi:hypothetical protein
VGGVFEKGGKGFARLSGGLAAPPSFDSHYSTPITRDGSGIRRKRIDQKTLLARFFTPINQAEQGLSITVA